jgi:hypothetical protein
LFFFFCRRTAQQFHRDGDEAAYVVGPFSHHGAPCWSAATSGPCKAS